MKTIFTGLYATTASAAAVGEATAKAGRPAAVKVSNKDENGWQKEVDPKTGQTMTKMSMAAPIINEDDQHATNTPIQYRCDACKGVVFGLNSKLAQEHASKNRRLKEFEYTEAFDHACAKNMDGYGLTNINGKNALSGPGIKKDEHIPSGGGQIMMGGGMWETRMQAICKSLVYDHVGEEEIYNIARQSSDKKIPEDVCRKPHSPFCNDEVKISKADRRAAKKAAKEAKKKEKAAKAKKAAAKKPDDEEADKISLVNFMEQLAISHGKPKGHYSSKRSMPQWKSLIGDLKMKGGKQEL